MKRFIFVLILIASAPSLAAQNKLPIRDWIRYPAFTNVVISPDGKHLAVAAAMKKNVYRYQVAILPTQSLIEGKPRIVAHFTIRNFQTLANVFWVNNNRIAAATATKEGGFNRPFLTGNLFVINVNGDFQKQLLSHNFEGLLSRLPSSRDAIIAEVPDGAIWLNTFTGSGHYVAHSPASAGDLLADHDGKVRLASGTNLLTGWPKLYYRQPGKLDWTNLSKLLNKNKIAAASLMSGGPVMFGPKNNGMYFEKWANNSAQTLGLYFYNFKTGKEKLLYANPKVDVDGLITSFDHKSIVGLYIEPGKPQAIALNPHAPKIQLLAGLMQSFPKQQANIVSATKNGNKAIVYTWSSTRPGMYYLYSSKPKPSLVPLFHETPWIKPGALSPMRPIAYKSRDGLTIHGYLTIPHGEKAKDLPLVVYVHGGPHGTRTDWGFNPDDFDSIAEQILANHGYAVLSLNFRGSGGYGLKFMDSGFRHWGSTMQNDLADGVAWAIKQDIANAHRICIFGASYGGYASLMNAERFPDLYQCAIGYDGLYDLAEWESNDSDTGRDAAGRLYQKTVLGHDEKQLKAFSPAFHADKLKIPVFLLQGGRDQRAPVDGYDEMVSAIKKHGTPLKTLFENNEGHGFYKPSHRIKAWKEILAFLNKYIGPDSKNVASNSH